MSSSTPKLYVCDMPVAIDSDLCAIDAVMWRLISLFKEDVSTVLLQDVFEVSV